MQGAEGEVRFGPSGCLFDPQTLWGAWYRVVHGLALGHLSWCQGWAPAVLLPSPHPHPHRETRGPSLLPDLLLPRELRNEGLQDEVCCKELGWLFNFESIWIFF